jgi:hypothetical protein
VLLRRPPVWFWPFGLALAVTAITKLCLPFDGLYGQDAFSYFRYARALWPHLLRGDPLPALYWPIGYPATMALLLPFTRGGPAAGQIVNAVACASAAGATSLLVHGLQRLDGRATEETRPAVLAGITVALSGAVLRSSQVVMADGLGLGLAAASLFCAVRYANEKRGGWLVASAVSLAWGAAARWMVGLLVLPLATFVLMDSHAAKKHADVRASGPRLWPSALAASFSALAVLAPVLIVAHSVPESLAKHEWLVAWNLQNAFGRAFHTPDGYARYRLPVALFYLVRLGWHDYFFPLHGALVGVGAWSVIQERRWSTSALLLGWPLTALLFLSGIPYENPRFLLPTLPTLAALWGIGYSVVHRQEASSARRLLVPLVFASVAAGLIFGAREHARLVAAKNADRELVAWTAARIGPDSNVLLEGPSLAFQYYASMPSRDLFSATPSEINALVTGGSPLFVLVDVHDLETQWAGLSPERNFALLSRSPGLAAIGKHGSYTLFRVASYPRE